MRTVNALQAKEKKLLFCENHHLKVVANWRGTDEEDVVQVLHETFNRFVINLSIIISHLIIILIYKYLLLSSTSFISDNKGSFSVLEMNWTTANAFEEF